jgi:large subunit ribosomal protein L35
MPKMKTNQAASKRFKATASGKLKRARVKKQHMLEWKSPKRKRQLGKGALVSVVDMPRIKRLVPYL